MRRDIGLEDGAMGNKLDVPKHLKRQERRRWIKLDKDFRRTVKKFSEMEMEYLTRVFEELARKVEPVDSIDKDTFMSFFPYQGCLGRDSSLCFKRMETNQTSVLGTSSP